MLHSDKNRRIKEKHLLVSEVSVGPSPPFEFAAKWRIGVQLCFVVNNFEKRPISGGVPGLPSGSK